MIVCCRMKQDHVQEQENGRWVVRKLGMKIMQDDDLEYEVNVALTMDMTHVLAVAKSRTNAIPVGTEYGSNHAHDFAIAYAKWLEGGEPVADKEDTDRLVEVLNGIKDDRVRITSKERFKDTFGRPEFLLVSRLHEAQEWVANVVLGNDDPPDRAEGAVPNPDTTHEQAPPVTESGVVCDDLSCQHDEAWHDEQGCHGTHAIPVPDTQDTIDVQCECKAFVDPQGGIDEQAPPDGDEHTAAEQRGIIEGEVEAMELGDVRDALDVLKRSKNGTVKELRKRLVDERMKVVTAPVTS